MDWPQSWLGSVKEMPLQDQMPVPALTWPTLALPSCMMRSKGNSVLVSCSFKAWVRGTRSFWTTFPYILMQGTRTSSLAWDKQEAQGRGLSLRRRLLGLPIPHL